MITPQAFHLIIKHVNEIDKRLSSKLLSKKPWDEISLTSALCDLFDEQTQLDENLPYNIKELNKDLQQDTGLIGLSLNLETIQFSSYFERYVSQSDLGIRIILNNQIEPKLSWHRSFLMQAKRLKPKSVNPLYYNEGSSFTAMNKDQEDRIEVLGELIGNSVFYLLYNPRPERLDDATCQKLLYLRTKILSGHIFDFTHGLEIYSELSQKQDTVGAGIFVASTKEKINNLASVHGRVFDATSPLSWFIATILNHDIFRGRVNNGLFNDRDLSSEEIEIIDGIIDGKKEIVDIIKEKYSSKGKIPENFTIYPKHVITLRYSIGENIDENHRRLRSEQ